MKIISLWIVGAIIIFGLWIIFLFMAMTPGTGAGWIILIIVIVVIVVIILTIYFLNQEAKVMIAKTKAHKQLNNHGVIVKIDEMNTRDDNVMIYEIKIVMDSGSSRTLSINQNHLYYNLIKQGRVRVGTNINL